jgi:hypothetical protein
MLERLSKKIKILEHELGKFQLEYDSPIFSLLESKATLLGSSSNAEQPLRNFVVEML